MHKVQWQKRFKTKAFYIMPLARLILEHRHQFMHFIVKLFPEIIVKSPPVRRRQTALLRDNLVRQFQRLEIPVQVHKDWEKIEVELSDDSPELAALCEKVLSQTPGVAKFSRAFVARFRDLEDIPRQLPNSLYNDLNGKTFAVRVKRSGQQAFKSVDVERLVGAWVLEHQPEAKVKLDNPNRKIELEVRGDRVFTLEKTWQGMGGYPLGSQGAVLSLLSGGYDSSVASYQCLRRGLLTHFVFFNLGGAGHELAVREVASHIHAEFAASHNLQFISVNFADVVEALRQHVPASYSNILLKRLMFEAASKIAQRMKLPALVTGDSVAQVSSQTLTNLSVTEKAAELPILRPLITQDKGAIIDIARSIGTADIAASIPEYCGINAVRPTTEAKLDRVEEYESRLPADLVDDAISAAKSFSVATLLEERDVPEVKSYSEIPNRAKVIDIRHPEEIENKPLVLDCEVEAIPFYAIQKSFESRQDKALSLLYCDRGLLSRLHAELLIESGKTNIAVYRPSR